MHVNFLFSVFYHDNIFISSNLSQEYYYLRFAVFLFVFLCILSCIRPSLFIVTLKAEGPTHMGWALRF